MDDQREQVLETINFMETDLKKMAWSGYHLQTALTRSQKMRLLLVKSEPWKFSHGPNLQLATEGQTYTISKLKIKKPKIQKKTNVAEPSFSSIEKADAQQTGSKNVTNETN